jgi:hypothetical protein
MQKLLPDLISKCRKMSSSSLLLPRPKLSDAKVYEPSMQAHLGNTDEPGQVLYWGEDETGRVCTRKGEVNSMPPLASTE